tara:strand:- start:12520 stop:13038 length:519 start_codon:yes stop_codon:yes gene_type:complete
MDVLVMKLVVEPLNTGVHAREYFSNSEPTIEEFLKKRANKECKLNISDTFVLVNEDKREQILGYFTLSLHSIVLKNIPADIAKKIPYPEIGTVLLGRMGKDQNLTPRGFGQIILKEALKESLSRGSFFALELHAKNVALISYYKKFGFIQLMDSPLHMILPRKQIVKACNTD